MNGSFIPCNGRINFKDEKMKEKIKNFIIKTDEMNGSKYQDERKGPKYLRRLKQNYNAKIAELIVGKVMFNGQHNDIWEIFSQYGNYIADVYSGDTKISVKSQDMLSIQQFGVGKFVFQDSNIKKIFNKEINYTHIAGVLILNKLNEINCVDDIILDTVDYLFLFCEPVDIVEKSFTKEGKLTPNSCFEKPLLKKFHFSKYWGDCIKYTLCYNKIIANRFV